MGLLLLFLAIAGVVVTGGLVFYLIVKRIHKRGNEGYEDRWN